MQKALNVDAVWIVRIDRSRGTLAGEIDAACFAGTHTNNEEDSKGYEGSPVDDYFSASQKSLSALKNTFVPVTQDILRGA